MVTRPLDLLSRLRPEPRNYDWLHFANAGLIGLFFAFFGSRFVVSPGVVVQDGSSARDIRLPVNATAIEAASVTSVYISVISRDVVFTDDGKYSFAEIQRWLKVQAARYPGSRLLVRADAAVGVGELSDIYDAARTAGFGSVILAAEPVAPATNRKIGP